VSFLKRNLSTSQNHLANGVGVRAAGHGVDHAGQAQTAGRHGGGGAEDAPLAGGDRRGRRHLGGRSVFYGEGARLGAPRLQGEDHGQVVACGERTSHCGGDLGRPVNTKDAPQGNAKIFSFQSLKKRRVNMQILMFEQLEFEIIWHFFA